MDHRCEKHDYEWNDVELILGNGKDFIFKVDVCPLCYDENNPKKQKDPVTNEEELKKERHEYWVSENIEPIYVSFSIYTIQSRSKSQDSALRAIKKMIKENSGMIFMLGNNGTGKTMLSKLAQMEFEGTYKTMYEISAEIRSTYVRGETSEMQIVKELSYTKFLIIDEIGKSKASEAELNWLNFIIDNRWSNKLPTIMISNKHLLSDCVENGCKDCLENYLTKDIIDRLKEGFLINFDGESERGK